MPPWNSALTLVVHRRDGHHRRRALRVARAPCPVGPDRRGGRRLVPAVHPRTSLHPRVVLYGLLPPLLYAAAIRTSLVDFRANRAPILGLSVGLVLFTAAGVGLVDAWLLPGAVRRRVRARRGRRAAGRRRRDGGRPPDRPAPAGRDDPRGRVAVQRRHRAGRRCAPPSPPSPRRPRRSASSPDGDSRSVALDFGWRRRRRRRRRRAGRRRHRAGPQATSPSRPSTPRSRSSSPFVAYLPAEQVHASGVLAVVVAGLLLGHKAPVLQTAPSRLTERINWAHDPFLLENAVFLLIGLQMRLDRRRRRRRPASAAGRHPRRLAGPASPWSCCGRSGCSRSR